MTNRGPAPRISAMRAVAHCLVTSSAMLARGQLSFPRENVGRTIRFADGTAGRVYRETVVDRAPREPTWLVVSFRLRWVHGRGHALFQWESVLNTPLFVGFPGFVSKLWLSHDRAGRYRGLYEWDGAEPAEQYARSLWRVLALVSEPGSIDYRVIRGQSRDQVLAVPATPGGYGEREEAAWWQVVAA